MTEKDAMPLGPKERILIIRLIDKVYANTAAAEKIGIIVDSEDTRKQSKAGTVCIKSET